MKELVLLGVLRSRLSIFFLLFSICVCAEESEQDTFDYTRTGLPVCFIETENGSAITSKFEYLNASIKIIDSEEVLLDSVYVQIRGRGNSTFLVAEELKKPYKIKFSKKVSLFGWKKNKHYALLANYRDKTLMRTAIGFKCSELMGMPYTPKCQYVELVLNGNHLGNYLLCEDVREGINRVVVGESGFFIERDTRFKDHPVSFHSTTYEYPYTFKYPDDETLDSLSSAYIYARDYVNCFEKALKNYEESGSREYTNYIDEMSFARWYCASNILAQYDPNLYYVKDDNTDKSKLSMGPLWDFDWTIGIGWYDGERPNPNHVFVNYCYFNQLNTDNLFMRKVHDALSVAGGGKFILQKLQDYYDELIILLQKSQSLNFKIWDILDKRVSVGGMPLGSWEKEVECDRQFLTNHINWMESELDKYTEETTEVFALEHPNHSCIEIYNLQGQRINPARCYKGIFILNGKKYIK